MMILLKWQWTNLMMTRLNSWLYPLMETLGLSLVPTQTLSLMHLFPCLHWLPLIHEYSAHSFLSATATKTQPCVATWLNSLKLTNQPAIYALLRILPFFVFRLCTCTCMLGLFLTLHCTSGTASFEKCGHQAHSPLSDHGWNLTSSSCPTDCLCIRVSMCARTN